MARRRVEVEPIDVVDVLRASRALRLGHDELLVGLRQSRPISLAEFVTVYASDLRALAASGDPGADAARILLAYAELAGLA